MLNIELFTYLNSNICLNIFLSIFLYIYKAVTFSSHKYTSTQDILIKFSKKLFLQLQKPILIRSTLFQWCEMMRMLKIVLKTFYNPEIASHHLSYSLAASLTAPFKNANNLDIQGRMQKFFYKTAGNRNLKSHYKSNGKYYTISCIVFVFIQGGPF